MLHVLVGKNVQRANSLEEALPDSFYQLALVALSVRVVGHVFAIIANFFDPIPDFSNRLALMLLVTSALLPLSLLYKHMPSFRSSSFLVAHTWALIQFPLEAMLYGAAAREVWLLFLASHAAGSILLSFNERKAVLMGGIALLLMVVGMKLDASPNTLNIKQVSVTIIAVPLISITEFFVARFMQVLWQKDVRIRELASQNETGLRMLSHDMANILSIARDSLEIAMEELENQNQKSAQERAQSSAESLVFLDESRFAIVQGVGMLQAVRDYLAIFSGKKDPAIEEFPLSDVLRDVVQLWQRPARKKQISLAFQCRMEREQTVVRGSRPLFTHTIVGNLVSNAIKFSPSKSRILVVLRKEDLVEELVIEVSDQGEGISDMRLTSIFEEQGRTSSAGTRGENGTGFGLPLVRATLEMFGGRISVDNSQGRYTLPNGAIAQLSGTTFSCRIPLRSGHPLPGSQSEKNAQTQGQRRAS
jgi:signal transduction histidine kinase